jgi:dipeptidase
MMCYMLAAGKKATADGSVFVARGCDAPSTEATRTISVPRQKHAKGTRIVIPPSMETKKSPGVVLDQVEETLAYTAVVTVSNEEYMPLVLGGINEYQVSVGASTGGPVKTEVATLTPWPETAIGDFLMTIALERSKTAREALEFLGEMTEKYGARTDNYIVADTQEVWLMEQYQGYHWAAVRIPDECFMVEANSFRITEVNPNDPDHYRCDPDLIPFAIKHGLWDPKSGQPFNASRAYGSNELNRPRGDLATPYYSLHRIWRGISLLNPTLKLDPYEPTKVYPLFVKPAKPITVEDMLHVLKDTYKGSELDEYYCQDADYPTVVNGKTGHYRLSPAWNKSRNIGCPQTITSWVTQSRAGMPNEIGGILWGGMSACATSPHIPWYCHNTRTPKEYRTANAGTGSEYMEDSAYWLYENITNLVNLFFQANSSLVLPVWEAFDHARFERQAEIEKLAMALYKNDAQKAVEFLTDYSNGIAMDAYSIGKEMMVKLFTRIAQLNNPQTVIGYISVDELDKNKGVY